MCTVDNHSNMYSVPINIKTNTEKCVVYCIECYHGLQSAAITQVIVVPKHST